MFDFLISRIKDYITLDDKKIRVIESLFVKNEPAMLKRISQYMIASYLGITPQALCRIKRKLISNN